VPGDVQTQDGGGTTGLAQTGDTISFTFSGTVDPASILSGWDGSAIAVTVHIASQSPRDVLTVVDPGTGAALTALGQVDLAANYANGTQLDFTSSQMTLSGNGHGHPRHPLGTAHLHTAQTTIVWTTTNGTATESGAADPEF